MLGSTRDESALYQADAFRVWAGLAVIWFHSIESPALRASGVLGRFSVAFYTILGMVLIFEGLARRSNQHFTVFAGKRLRRLYLPFLGWSALTGAALFLLHAVDPKTHPVPLRLSILVSGTAEPLWFVPFFLVGSAIVFPLAKWSVGRVRREIAVAVLCGMVALGLDLIPWNDPPLRRVPLVGDLLRSTWNRWSAVYWGVVVAIAYRRWLIGWRWMPVLAILGIALAVGVGVWQWSFGIVPALKVAGGLGLVIASLGRSRNDLIRRVAKWGPLTYGLYLSHSLWIAVARAAAHLCGIPVSWERDVLVFIIAASASILSVQALFRSPALSWLVGGSATAGDARRRQQGVVDPAV